jgi:toxin ParE1/3/4
MKKYAVHLTEAAMNDLASLHGHVSEVRSAEAADALVDRLEAACRALERLPLRGRAIPELAQLGGDAIRELVRKPYRIFYEVVGKDVYVFGIVDGRRDLRELLARRVLGQ